jgi:hypothetical protein
VLGLLLSLPPLLLIPALALIIGTIIHAANRGLMFPWIYIIVFLPGLGAIAYLLGVVLPEFTRGRTAANLHSGVRNLVDPNKSFRQAHRDAGMVGSVDAKRALADEYITRGRYPEAVEIYTQAAQGQFKDDPALLLGLARAQFLAGNPAGTQEALDTLQAADPSFVSADAHLLYARALEGQGKIDEALTEYRRLVPYYSGEEARARLAMLLEKTGHRDEAREVYKQIVALLDGAPSRYRRAQSEWGTLARRALR